MAMHGGIPVAQPIPVALPVSVAQAQARARAEEELRQQGVITHELKKGDTVQSLAMRYGVSAEVIKRRNKLWSHDSLAARSVVIIPKRENDDEMDCLPYRKTVNKGGLDKTSADRLFSSCDDQLQQARTALTGFSQSLSLGSSQAAAAAVSSAPPYDSHAHGSTGASSGQQAPPPTYESCAGEAETVLGASGSSSDLGNGEVAYLPSINGQKPPEETDTLLAEL